MTMYRISCFSECGSYFQPYLNELYIQAQSTEHAIELAQVWQDKHKEYFIKTQPKDWVIEKLPNSIGVVHYNIQADY